MTAAFKFRDELFWGTNGAIEGYLEALADRAFGLFGPGDQQGEFFRYERESWSMGKLVALDELLTDRPACKKFLQILDASTEKILQDDVFTDLGKEWIRTTVSALRSRVADAAQ
jgi:hypothetical protein